MVEGRASQPKTTTRRDLLVNIVAMIEAWTPMPDRAPETHAISENAALIASRLPKAWVSYPGPASRAYEIRDKYGHIGTFTTCPGGGRSADEVAVTNLISWSICHSGIFS